MLELDDTNAQTNKWNENNCQGQQYYACSYVDGDLYWNPNCGDNNRTYEPDHHTNLCLAPTCYLDRDCTWEGSSCYDSACRPTNCDWYGHGTLCTGKCPPYGKVHEHFRANTREEAKSKCDRAIGGRNNPRCLYDFGRFDCDID